MQKAKNTPHINLNSAQRRAVEHQHGPLLVVAGAGAGKTRVITERIATLIKKGITPPSILAITFTNKAAQEMKDRVTARLEGDTDLNRPISIHESPFVSTFHSLGTYLLRQYGSRIGIKRSFSIADRSDSERVVRHALKELGYDPKQWSSKKLLGTMSRMKGNMETRAELSERSSHNPYEHLLKEVWEIYEREMTKSGALDFDDLLIQPIELLQNSPDVRKTLQNQWQYIHIDEYQDTNTAQYELVQLLVGTDKNICVVGDADQTIYTWRGAQVENILAFEEDYPDATIVLLEENYRSTPNILGAANNIITKNTLRKDKNLFTRHTEGELIRIIATMNEKNEAHYIAETASQLIQEGLLADEIAVLYRTNFQSRALEEAMITYEVPYQVLGTRFYERKEVRDCLAYIDASLNPDNLHALERIINEPRRGIGKVTFAKVASGMREQLSPAQHKKVDGFFALLGKIRKVVETSPASSAIKEVIRISGLEEKYKDGSEEEQERYANLQELATLALKYDAYDPPEGIHKLLEDAALATDQDELDERVRSRAPEKTVKLMTVHASKGLEFDTVFVTGLEQGLFPQEKDSALLAEQEEERRLMYVAITRAKRQLFLVYTHIRRIFGSPQVNVPSEFLSDIDNDYLAEGIEPTEREGSGLLDDIEY